MLDHETIDNLHAAAVEALTESRRALLDGISRKIVAQLKDATSPSEQLLRDLHELNGLGVLPDGTIPLETWLRNAWRLTAGTPQAAVFREALEALVGPAGAHPKADKAPLRLLADRPKEEAYLLERVRVTWVDGLLRSSLQEELRIQLARTEQPDAVEAPLAFRVSRTDEEKRDLDPGESIGAYFERRRLRALLVLGEPGSGKTVTLLELTEAWLCRAEEDPSQPIPVVLNLSSWSARRQPIEAWVVEQLSTQYFVGKTVGREWVKGHQLAYLFDGLDEVEESAQLACVDALNVFRKGHGVSPIAVACRRAEYETLKGKAKLDLDAAIRLRDISEEQLEIYLQSPRLLRLKKLISGDSNFQELARTPLMLSVMTLAYADDDEAGDSPPSERTRSLEEARRALFDRYVIKMFDRAEEQARRTRTELPLGHLSRERVLRHLIWLARDILKRGQEMFSLEQIQPWSLPDDFWRTAYFLVSRVVGVSIIVGLYTPLTMQVWQDGVYEFPMLGLWGQPPRSLPLATLLASGPAIGALLGLVQWWSGRRVVRPGSDRTPPPVGGLLTILLVWAALWLLAHLSAPDTPLNRGEGGLLGGFLFFVLLGREWRLTDGNDHATVESLGIRWKRLGALAMVACIPAAIAWHSIATGGHNQRLSIPDLASVPMPVTGDATFLSDDLAAVGRYDHHSTALLNLESGHIQTAPFTGQTVFSGDGRSALSTGGSWFGTGRSVQLHQRRGAEWKPGKTFDLSWTPRNLTVHCAALSYAGDRVIASDRRNVWIHSSESGKIVGQSPGTRFRLTTDRRHVSIPQLGGLTIRNSQDGAELVRLTSGATGAPLDADVHPLGGWVAFLDDRDGVYRVEPTGHEKPSLLVRLTRRAVPVGFGSIVFSPTGERIAVATREAVFLLDLEGRILRRQVIESPESWLWPGCVDREPRVSFSADGSILMEHHENREEAWITLFRASDGALFGSVGPFGTSTPALSPNGATLIAAPSRTSLNVAATSMLLTVLGAVAALLASLRAEVVKTKSHPNEGMRLTAKWSLFVSLGGMILTVAVLEAVRATNIMVTPSSARFLIPLFVGVGISYIYGGLDVFQHYLVRLLLALRGDLPFRSVPFLDGAARLVLLRKVGGGYIFIHRLFTEYVAADAERLLTGTDAGERKTTLAAPRDLG